MCQRLRNLGAKFSETSFPHFKTYFTQINHCYHLRQQFNRFDSNNFTLSSMISFQNAWPIKRKAVYTLLCLLQYLFIFLVRIRLGHNFLFQKSTFLLVNLQAVAGGRKFCFSSGVKFYHLPPDKENTSYLVYPQILVTALGKNFISLDCLRVVKFVCFVVYSYCNKGIS